MTSISERSGIVLPPEMEQKLADAKRALWAVEEEVAEYCLLQLTEEPKCPECGSGVLRPKCFYDMGGACPRHEVVSDWGGHSRLHAHASLVKAGWTPVGACWAWAELSKVGKHEVTFLNRTEHRSVHSMTGGMFVEAADRLPGGKR